MAPIYVTGRRIPDTDSVASAIGYAELKRRLDRANEYIPVRLGEHNAQTTWVLARAGAPVPEFLPHVGDVMRTDFPVASDDEPEPRSADDGEGVDDRHEVQPHR